MTNKEDTTFEPHRIYASLSFVGVLFFIGVPLWWKTTEVYRVSLPYGRIAELDKFPFKISMAVQLAVENETLGLQLKRYLEKEFSESDVFDIKFEMFSRPQNFDLSPESLKKMDKGPGSLVLVEWPLEEENVRVTFQRVVIYSPKASSNLVSRVLSEWILSISSLRDASKATSYSRHDKETRRRFPPSDAYDITLTVAAPNPDKITVQWSPKEAIEDYVQPFVSELNIIHNFTLKSQWLYFLPLEFKPKQVLDNTPVKRHYMLSEETLPHLITPLEKKLGSHISKNPCINLVLYLPACEDSPIHIYNQHGRIQSKMDAFISPRWGGVVIANPPPDICAYYLENLGEPLPIFKPVTGDIMGYFLSQLRVLLGIPQKDSIDGVTMDPLITVSPRRWELDALVRIRAVEQAVSAKLTLKSLSQLLGEISNIVINDDVGASIYNAVDNVEKTDELLKNGQLLDALETSRNAFLSAEAAFTDPTLLALLYFPDDQKYAVYMPLFLPILVPVLLAAKNVWLWMKSPQTKDKTE